MATSIFFTTRALHSHRAALAMAFGYDYTFILYSYYLFVIYILSMQGNFGYDDDRGDYCVVPHDHLAYRYEVLGLLGKGSFGQVCVVCMR